MADVDLHVCYVSEWMNGQGLCVRARPGDLVEFDRGKYKVIRNCWHLIVTL